MEGPRCSPSSLGSGSGDVRFWPASDNHGSQLHGLGRDSATRSFAGASLKPLRDKDFRAVAAGFGPTEACTSHAFEPYHRDATAGQEARNCCREASLRALPVIRALARWPPHRLPPQRSPTEARERLDADARRDRLPSGGPSDIRRSAREGRRRELREAASPAGGRDGWWRKGVQPAHWKVGPRLSCRRTSAQTVFAPCWWSTPHRVASASTTSRPRP